MPANDQPSTVPNPEETFNDLLTYAALLNTPRLARLYIYILQHGPVEIETIKSDLEMAHSTTYKYIGQLEEMGLLSRDDDVTPTTVTVTPIRLQLDTEHGDVLATPALVDAVGRQFENEDIRVFVERQEIAKLAAALHYTLRVMNGELTQRTAATKLGVHPVEGMAVFTALQDVVEDAASYDPYLEFPETDSD
jgi:DNA-binding MarR family transcriptional regulator